MYDLYCILHNDLFSVFASRTLAVETSHEVTNKFSCRILSLPEPNHVAVVCYNLTV